MAHIFCVAQQFTSVTVYVLGKKIMSAVDVYHFVFLRTLFVVPLVLIAASLFTRKLSAFKLPLKAFGLMAASGIIGIFIAQSLVFVGLDKSTATNTSIISAPCTPLFTALFSVMRGTDKMNIPKGFGFLSSMLGALLLLQVWNFEFAGKTMGNLLIVGSAICNALNSLIQKQVLNDGHHPLVVQFYICSVGIISYTVGYSGFGLFGQDSWVISGNVWMYISIVGIVATAIPWCVSIIALKHTSPMTTSVYVVLQPLIAGFIGVVMMGEVLTWIQMLGGGLVILGLVLVNAQPIVQRFFFRSKTEFALLPSEDAKEIELTVISDNFASLGDSKEVQYDLAKGETNTLIEDGADFISDPFDKPDYISEEEIFTPELTRHKHGYERTVGDNFSVTLFNPEAILISEDESDYNKEGVEYSQEEHNKESSDFYPSSCKRLSEHPAPTLRAIA